MNKTHSINTKFYCLSILIIGLVGIILGIAVWQFAYDWLSVFIIILLVAVGVLGVVEFFLIVFLKGQAVLKVLIGGLLAIFSFFVPITNQRINHLTPIATGEALVSLHIEPTKIINKGKLNKSLMFGFGGQALRLIEDNRKHHKRIMKLVDFEPYGKDGLITTIYLKYKLAPFEGLLGTPIGTVGKYKIMAIDLLMLPAGTKVTGGKGFMTFNASKRYDFEIEKQKVRKVPTSIYVNIESKSAFED